MATALAGYGSKLYASSDGGSNYVAVGGIKDVTFSNTLSTYETTNKDSGAVKEFIAGRREYKREHIARKGTYETRSVH